jgi:hypothetical protein
MIAHPLRSPQRPGGSIMHSCSAIVMDVVLRALLRIQIPVKMTAVFKEKESPDECRICARTGIQVNLTPIPSYHWELKFPE